MSTESTTPEVAQSGDFDPTLIEAVKKQVEYYFSKENLQSDVFLQSQMDAQMSVSIAVIMKFAKMKALTTDEAVVRRAVQESSLTLVNNRIKANIKASSRSTIILRDVPANTPEEEVRDIFNYDGARPIVSLRSDIEDTWFVNFEVEEDAKQTLLDLRMKKRTFRGASVKARIKTEQVVRSYYPVQVAAPPAPMMGIPPPMGFPGVPFPPIIPSPEMFGYVVPPIDPALVMEGFNGAEGADAAAEGAHDAEGQQEAGANNHEHDNEESKTKAANKAGDKTAAARPAAKAANTTAVAARKETAATTKTTANNNRKGAANTAASSSNNNRTDRHHGKHEHTSTATTAAAAVSKPAVEINSINFPPLSTDATPAPTPGYQGEYLKYTIDDVIMIVKSNVQDANLPAEVNAAEHSLAMQTDANLDLLKRQRTFTIDETREQLRQGRPITSGLLFGSVDYRSLHYGDDTGASAPAAPASTSSHHHSYQQQLSTIEERNEALNMSGDTLNASALEMSMEMDRLNLNESSFIEPTPSTNAQAGSVSPARINASSWAAMVKSAADIAAASPAPTPVAPRTTATKPTSTAAPVAQKEAAEKVQAKKTKPATPATTGETAPKEKKTEKKQEKTNSNKTAQPKQNRSKGPATEATAEKQADAESAEGAGSSAGWGGKSSFASVLKLKAEEDAAAAAAAAATAATRRPVATTTNTNSTAPNSNTKAANGSGFQQRGTTAPAATTNAFRRDRDEKIAPKSSSINEAGGMWAKETLPPLAKNSKADALKSDA